MGRGAAWTSHMDRCEENPLVLLDAFLRSIAVVTVDVDDGHLAYFVTMIIESVLRRNGCVIQKAEALAAGLTALR